MDRITKSYLEKFREEQSLGSISEADAFEHFSNFCIVSALYEEEFDVSAVRVAGEGDLGIDGLAILVNGVLVDSKEVAEDLLKMNGFLDVEFVFVQAKTSSVFHGEQIVSFFDGVDEFFAEHPTLPNNDHIKAAREVMSWVYENSLKFTRQKPHVNLNYVTTGSWKDDAHLMGKIAKRRQVLLDSGLFGAVDFQPLGADEVQAAYLRSKNNVTVEFSFASKVLLPEIDGVNQAYLGVIPAKEYLSLITDTSGHIRKPLFYDNVRDFKGDLGVNAEIRHSLESDTGQQRFAVLNNGITVVTRGLRNTGNKFVITDYQIVNGCQTSHVLFNAKDELKDDLFIPLKVIETEDEDIITSIITATNRQTEVTQDDLYATSSFQKKLEGLFEAYPAKKKLYYERRSMQYASSPIEKVRIIGKTVMLRSFAAMFLDEPHKAARYISDLHALVGNKIFNPEHQLEPYYAAAYGHYKLEFLFRNSSLPVYYKPARFHLLMALRHITGGKDMPSMTSNKMTKYANGIAETLWSEQGAIAAFNKAIEAVDAALEGQPLTRDLIKLQSFSEAVKNAAIASVAEIPYTA